jgi:hypothetical protein
MAEHLTGLFPTDDPAQFKKEVFMIGGLIVKQKVPAAFGAMNQHDLDTFLKNYSDDAAFV